MYVFRLCNIIEPLAALFWSLHCTCAYTETVDPACRPSISQQWFWHATVRHGSVRFNLKEGVFTIYDRSQSKTKTPWPQSQFYNIKSLRKQKCSRNLLIVSLTIISLFIICTVDQRHTCSA